MNIAILGRRRRGGGGGPPAPPVVTSIVVTPNPFTVNVGSTQQLVAQAYDQSGNPIADTFTWGTSNAGLATVNSSGLVTGVAAGSPVITATSVTKPAVSGTSNGTVTNNTVTSMNLFYAGPQTTQDVSTYNGLLLFTGTTYPLIAKDQSGNTLSSGVTWATTDGTNAPINITTGVVSPNAGVGGGTITATHTASGVTKTVKFSVLKTPPAIYKQMGNPTSTTGPGGLMSQIWDNQAQYNDSGYNGGLPLPTNPTQAGSLYTDGQGVNHFSIDASTPGRQLMGKAGMVKTLTTGDLKTAELDLFAGPFFRSWGLSVLRFDPGFDPNGTGTGAAAFKWGNWFTPGVTGRVGAEQSGPDIDNYVISTNPTGGPGPQRVGGLTTEYTGGETWINIILYEQRGGNIMSSRMAWFKIGDVPTTPFGGVTLEGPMSGGAARSGAPPNAFQYIPSTINYNRAPVPYTLYVTQFDWQMVDGDTYGDPYGILAATGLGTPTLTGISGGTINQGAGSASITLTGTNFNTNCQPVFSNAKIYPQSITINSPTSMTVVVAVDATATTGAGTVVVNNQASQTTSGTQVVTVNSSGYALTSATPSSLAPGATSQNIALVGTGFASGCNAIFSNAGITVNSTTFNSSTSLTANVTVSGGATPGAGTVLVRNASSVDTNTVTFTVASSPPTSGLVRRYVASAGTNTTTNGAAITTWTDQVTGTVQLTSALTGITYVSSALNGKPGLACNGVTNNNLQESGYDAAINTADTTVVVVAARSGGSGFTGILNLSAANRGIGMEASGAGVLDAYTGSGSGFTSIGAYSMGAGYHTLMLTANHTTPAEVLYVDNTSQATGATAYASNTSAVLTLFGYGSSGTPFQGTIVEVLIYGHDLNSTERTNLAAYINAAYGI